MSRTTMLTVAVLLFAGLVLADGVEAPRPVFKAPVKLECAGEPINVTTGHAAPHVIDWNSDGKPDLLVGQFGGGRLRIYGNVGTAAEPVFGGFEYLRAGGAEATVPSG